MALYSAALIGAADGWGIVLIGMQSDRSPIGCVLVGMLNGTVQNVFFNYDGGVKALTGSGENKKSWYSASFTKGSL